MKEEFSRLTVRYDRLQMLYQVSNVIHSTVEAQEALQLIVKRGRPPDERHLRIGRPAQSHFGTAGNFRVANLPSAATKLKLRVGEGVTGWVARHGKPLRVGNVTQDTRYLRRGHAVE